MLNDAFIAPSFPSTTTAKKRPLLKVPTSNSSAPRLETSSQIDKNVGCRGVHLQLLLQLLKGKKLCQHSGISASSSSSKDTPTALRTRTGISEHFWPPHWHSFESKVACEKVVAASVLAEICWRLLGGMSSWWRKQHIKHYIFQKFKYI